MAAQPTPDPGQPSTGKVARDAAVHELVSFGVYVALVVGFSVAIAKRDALARAQMRARQFIFPPRLDWHDAEVAAFRRDLSAYDHGDRPC